MPHNPQCTFSPTAVWHYLLFEVTTKHLDSLLITTHFLPFYPFPLTNCNFIIISPLFHPNKCPQASIIPTVCSATSEAPFNHLFAHQHLGHGQDKVLDTICQQQSLLGLPKHPYPQQKCLSIICITTKTTHPPKAKMSSSTLTSRGQLLHIDFSFWMITSNQSTMAKIECYGILQLPVNRLPSLSLPKFSLYYLMRVILLMKMVPFPIALNFLTF